ncbi:MAG: glycosyltransferase family 4 protein [Rhizobiaceae bacterium]|nr:glycosyltransferase family 4 protein [Rhizobiaceae bacterium]
MHYEGRSRPRQDNPREIAAYRKRYGKETDPYYNLNLSLEDETFSIHPRCSSAATEAFVAIMVSHDLALEGAPKCMFDLVVALRDKGIVVPKVVSPKDGPLRGEYEKQGIEVAIVPFDLDLNIGSSLAGLDAAIAPLRTMMRATQASVVYANTLVTFWAIAAAHREGLPSIWNPRESFPSETYFNYLPAPVRAEAYACFGFAYKVLFVSNASRRNWARFDSAYRFEVITDSLRDEDVACWRDRHRRDAARRDLGIDEDAICLLALGTVWDHKGQMDIVKALKGLDADIVTKIRIFIVGDRPGAYSDSIKNFAAQELTDLERSCLHILPATDDPYQFLAAADVGLCCSRVDTFPRVILEYMAFDLPIITTPVFGIAEQVQPNVNAKIYEPDDIPMLRAHIRTMSTNSDERKRMATNSEPVLRCLPDFHAMVERYAQVFREARFAPVDTE